MPIIKFPPKYIIIAIMVIVGLILTACATPTQEKSSESAEDSQTDIFIPAIESDSEENINQEAEYQAYPETDQEIQNTEISDADQSEAAQSEVVPESDVETQTQELKSTPRGNELVATDPSTVNLATGQPQLVELFAFW